MKKGKKITFGKGIKRINFPILFPKDFRDEIMKVQKMKLPKYRAIGFEATYYTGSKELGSFEVYEVYILK